MLTTEEKSVQDIFMDEFKQISLIASQNIMDDCKKATDLIGNMLEIVSNVCAPDASLEFKKAHAALFNNYAQQLASVSEIIMLRLESKQVCSDAGFAALSVIIDNLKEGSNNG